MKRKGSLLIVEGDRGLRTALQRLLMPGFEEVVATSSPVVLPKLLAERKWRVLLLEVAGASATGDEKDGLYWLRKVKRLAPDLPVVLAAAYCDIGYAVRGVTEGAKEFVVKPCDIQKLAKLLTDVADAHEAAVFAGESAVPCNDIYKEAEKSVPLPDGEAVLPIVERLIADFCRKYGRRPMKLTQEASLRLTAGPRYENIDELAYAVEKAVILCDGGEIAADLFPVSGWVVPKKKPAQPNNG